MSIIKKILPYLNLESDLDDFDKIHETIEKDIVFRGTNLWILVFAIIVASVGLNMNSTAVVIGAMLISPLMGPINGMGYGIATFNFPLFRKALKNFGFAVGAGLFASTAYFAISPVSTAHSELLARTSPTIYDVLIALFGGLAGIVAISSRLKGNVIPGVAIATALMPPLCTAGYGLATAEFNYFFGALYLFTINTVFIALSSIFISQLLKFPIRTIVDNAQKIKVNRWLSMIIVITIIPSIYFGYGLVQKEKFSENAARYIRNVNVVEGNYLLKSETDPSSKTITLVYGGNSLSEAQKHDIKEKMKDFSLNKAELIILQGFSFQDINSQDRSEVEISRLRSMVKIREAKLDSLRGEKMFGKQLLAEVKTIFPQVLSCSYAETKAFEESDPFGKEITIVVVKTTDVGLDETEREKFENWLSERIKTVKIEVYYNK